MTTDDIIRKSVKPEQSGHNPSHNKIKNKVCFNQYIAIFKCRKNTCVWHKICSHGLTNVVIDQKRN